MEQDNLMMIRSRFFRSARVPRYNFVRVKAKRGAFIAYVVLSGLLGLNAMAQVVSVVGTGTARCAQFNSAIADRPIEEREYFAWAQGYMSGILLSAPPGVDDALALIREDFPITRQITLMRSFCQRFPDRSYSDGVEALYRALGGTAIR